MSRWIAEGHPDAGLTADVVAICRALLAVDTKAVDVVLDSNPDPVALLLAAAWLVIGCHRAVLGDDPAVVDEALADMQRQWINLQARTNQGPLQHEGDHHR